MGYMELVKKIDAVIENVDTMNITLKDKLSSYTDTIISFTNNQLKYQYEVAKKAYQIHKTKNKIEKNNYFKERCVAYINYLKSRETNDALNIRMSEYEYLKILQDESFYYYDTKLEEFKMRKKIEELVGEEQKSKKEINNLIKEKNKACKYYTKYDFKFNTKKIYSLDYLNYDVGETLDLIYMDK